MALANTSRRQKAGLLLSFGMIALAMGGVLNALRNDPIERSSTTSTLPITTTTLPDLAPYGETGLELERLLGLARKVTVHGQYAVDDETLPDGLVQSFEVWRDGVRQRTDIIERLNGAESITRSVTDGTVSITCKVLNGEKQCEKVAASATIDLANLFVLALADADGTPELQVRDDEVNGFVARCFTAEEVGELCLASDGVLLSTQLETATIVVTSLDESVPGGTFDVTIPNRKVPTTTSTAPATSAVPDTTQSTATP